MDAVTVRKNGKAEMAWVGETPWHGLGQKLEDGLGIDAWKEAAGMDFNIANSPVTYANGLVFGGKKVLYREDDPETHLGIVGDRYQVVQPGEVLEFFRDLVEEQGLKLNTAGTLFGGRRFWGLASLDQSVDIVKKDTVRGFLLLATSADGSLATTAQFTTVRVVCNNTLGMSLAETKGKTDGKVAVRHTSQFDAKSVKKALGLAPETMKAFQADMQRLQERVVSVEEAKVFVHKLLIDQRVVSSPDLSKAKAVGEIVGLFDGRGRGADLVGKTAWGLLNAVTEFTDHHMAAKTDSHRLDSAWFGRGNKLKDEARERLLEIA